MLRKGPAATSVFRLSGQSPSSRRPTPTAVLRLCWIALREAGSVPEPLLKRAGVELVVLTSSDVPVAAGDSDSVLCTAESKERSPTSLGSSGSSRSILSISPPFSLSKRHRGSSPLRSKCWRVYPPLQRPHATAHDGQHEPVVDTASLATDRPPLRRCVQSTAGRRRGCPAGSSSTRFSRVQGRGCTRVPVRL